MCGRTACTLCPDELPKACKFRGKNGKVQTPQWRQGSSGQYSPSYNVAPQAHTPVLISTKHVPPTNGEERAERTLQTMKWGLIPSWYKGEPSKFEYKMNNARSDTLLDKASYRTPLLLGRRCVVLADGFYEWKTENGKKQPYYIYFKNKQNNNNDDTTPSAEESKQLLTMAGLFDCWKSKGASGEDEILYSYAVITVDASDSMKWLHHRMPAILDGEEAIRNWLDYKDITYAKALHLLTSVNCLDWNPVSPVMNNSRYNTPDCIKPIDVSKTKDSKIPSKGTITSWFVKTPKKEDTTAQTQRNNSPRKTGCSKMGTLGSWLIKSPKKESKEEEDSPSTKRRKLE